MLCTKCSSDNTQIQMLSETITKRKRRGLLYWLLIGWWLELILWFCLTIPRFLIALFIPKRTKTINRNFKVVVCQKCGHSWEI